MEIPTEKRREAFEKSIAAAIVAYDKQDFDLFWMLSGMVRRHTEVLYPADERPAAMQKMTGIGAADMVVSFIEELKREYVLPSGANRPQRVEGKIS